MTASSSGESGANLLKVAREPRMRGFCGKTVYVFICYYI
jgi:hypothetical protein